MRLKSNAEVTDLGDPNLSFLTDHDVREYRGDRGVFSQYRRNEPPPPPPSGRTDNPEETVVLSLINPPYGEMATRPHLPVRGVHKR